MSMGYLILHCHIKRMKRGVSWTPRMRQVAKVEPCPLGTAANNKIVTAIARLQKS